MLYDCRKYTNAELNVYYKCMSRRTGEGAPRVETLVASRFAYEAFRRSASSSLKPKTLVEGPFDGSLDFLKVVRLFPVPVWKQAPTRTTFISCRAPNVQQDFSSVMLSNQKQPFQTARQSSQITRPR